MLKSADPISRTPNNNVNWALAWSSDCTKIKDLILNGCLKYWYHYKDSFFCFSLSINLLVIDNSIHFKATFDNYIPNAIVLSVK